MIARYHRDMKSKVRRWMSLALITIACLVVEGAVVVGIAWGVGALMYEPTVDTVPALVPGIDGR